MSLIAEKHDLLHWNQAIRRPMSEAVEKFADRSFGPLMPGVRGGNGESPPWVVQVSTRPDRLRSWLRYPFVRCRLYGFLTASTS